MADCIERQKAIDLFYRVDPENDGSDGCTVVYKVGNYSSDEIEAMLSDLPAADVVPVRHGRWVYGEDVDIQCSICGHDAYTEGDYRQVKTSYCPNCGAKMDKEDEYSA